MVLVLVEHDRGRLQELSLQALAFGRGLAARLGVPLEAALVGERARPLAEGLAAHGVASVHLAVDERLDDYAPDAWAACLDGAAAGSGATAVLAAGTDRGNEVLARLAARRDLPFAANCVAIEPGDVYAVTRLRWGGSLLEEGTLAGDPKLASVAPHAVQAEEAPSASPPEIRTFAPELDDADLLVRVGGREEAAGGGVTLAEAKVVVGGGRGVGGPDRFADLEELAGLLGGVVGVSRVATSLGWRPHSDQIGQTGTRIAPDLYIACGISGAIQHMVGCKAAKHLLAVNTDPEAPIMQRADYAVIGDLHEVVTAVIAEVRRANGG